eukprot:TRINITY_DN16727_c0_g1_i2.p3 TRINITY_DN16727_c0_g1~~TRINITY_DN16727_c0_g1_i2.p3  ORF type:complete len:133 (-),score=25.05 TRINITY_DN16727_c0_g1_i2:11-409(-)
MQRGLVGSEMCIRDRIIGVGIATVVSVILIITDNKLAAQVVLVAAMFGLLLARPDRLVFESFDRYTLSSDPTPEPVSYTHLTLPTILLVQISVVAVSLKKKTYRLQMKVQKQERDASVLRMSSVTRCMRDPA